MKAKTIGFLANAGISSAWVFIPLLAKDLGASDIYLGAIGTVYGFAIFISSYYFGRLSDHIGRRVILRLGLFLSGLSFLLLLVVNNPLTLLVVRFIQGFTVGMFPPALVAYVNDRKGKLGKFSSFQSLGWAAGSFIAGVLTAYYEIFIASSILFFISFAISLRMDDSAFVPRKVPFFPINIIKKNLGIYLGYFIRHFGAQTVWIVFPLFLQMHGVSRAYIGYLFTLNSCTQFVVMQFTDSMDPRKLIPFGFSVAGAAFIVMVSFPMLWAFVLGMFMIGISWGTAYSGSVIYLSKKNPEMGTSTGLLQSAISFSNAMGPILGGTMAYVTSSYATPLLFAGFMGFAGALVFLLLDR